MENKNIIPLSQWSKQFTTAQKDQAKKTNNYYAVVQEFKMARKNSK